MQSSPSTIDGDMVTVLRVNAFALLFLAIWFIVQNYRIIRIRRDLELGETA